MIVHLLESTLLLAIAILIAHMPRLAARTRYMVVFAALMKFAIPSAIVPRMLALAGLDLTRMPKGTILIKAFGPLTATNLPATTAPLWPLVAITLWLMIATALVIRSAIRGRAGMRLALSDAFDADARELVVLSRACSRADITRTVRLVRSPSITTPVTAGIVRPVIVIPAGMQLGDSELETILTHECAHIARRDSVLGIVESIAGCALWFHPLVWIARRVLDATREEACDAVVIASGDASVYVTALGKVCGAAIAPRTAGISCIVSNTIRERMDAIMQFGTRRLLPHQAVMATVIALLAVATIGIGVARALPADEQAASSNYKVSVIATRNASPDHFIFDVTVRDRKSGAVVAHSLGQAGPETRATSTTTSDHETRIGMIGHADGTAEVDVTVDHEPPILVKIISKRAETEVKPKGENISIDLKNADIRDVLKTFSQLTNTEIDTDDDVYGRVTISVHDVPWKEVFAKILDDANLRQKHIGDTIHVYRK